MLDKDVLGTVFNVQKFTVHDGKGIRTLVFLKGCPLRCKWCCNPESQVFAPERVFNVGKCLSIEECGRCVEACPNQAISELDGFPLIDGTRCKGCLKCVEVCPAKAMNVYGEKQSVGEVLDRVEQDGVFYSRSGGGLTLSGGEATGQPDFALALLREARKRHIDRVMETCGHCDTETLLSICGLLNSLIFDIKLMDPARHKAATGVDNALILRNFGQVLKTYPALPILVRTPVVPGINDTEADIQAVIDFLPRRKGLSYELMAYHRMGQPKYGYLGREFPMGAKILDETLFKRLTSMAHAWNAGNE